MLGDSLAPHELRGAFDWLAWGAPLRLCFTRGSGQDDLIIFCFHILYQSLLGGCMLPSFDLFVNSLVDCLHENVDGLQLRLVGLRARGLSLP